MRKPKRQDVVKTEQCSLNIHELEGSAEEIYKLFKHAEEGYLVKGYASVRFDVYSLYEDCELQVTLTRPETDAEYEKRLARAAKERVKFVEDKKKKEEAERELYERLKKKFAK